MPVQRLPGVVMAGSAQDADEEARRGILLTTVGKAVAWARKNSMWPATFGLACCAIETGELAAELIADALARGRPAIAQMYPVLLRERYGRYYFVGRQWVRMIGHPRFMHFAVRHGFPRAALMRFALTFMANLTDGKDGGRKDRLMHAMVSLAPDS